MHPPPVSLDQGRWTGLWSRLGARGDGLSIWHHLTSAYTEPGRVYHTTEHLSDCLNQFDLSRRAAQRPDDVEAALWFHDSVYSPTRSDNEERSAELARASLVEFGVSPEIAGRIAELVLATRHLTISSEPDPQLLCDIDLSILGRTPEEFDEFERRIRREYAWVPEPMYRTSRSEVLAGFLRRAAIYQTSWFKERYELQARVNLARLLERLANPTPDS